MNTKNFTVLKACLALMNSIAAICYAMLRLLFYDFPFTLREEIKVIASTLATACTLAAAIFGIYMIAKYSVYYLRHFKMNGFAIRSLKPTTA